MPLTCYPEFSRRRLYQACPSVLLGTLFNILDAGNCKYFFLYSWLFALRMLSISHSSIHGSAPVPFRWLYLQKLSDTRDVHVHHEVCVNPPWLRPED